MNSGPYIFIVVFFFYLLEKIHKYKEYMEFRVIVKWMLLLPLHIFGK